MRRFLAAMTAAVLLLNTVGCGTLIYPERRGQTSGRIDPGIAILDGVGLLVFIIPGLIAFGVDFMTGAIYMPGGEKTTAVVPLGEGPVDPAAVEQLVVERTGSRVSFDDPRMEVVSVASHEELIAMVATD